MALRDLEAHDLGLTWTIDEPQVRASHALVDDRGRVWLVDPVDEPAALERVAGLGEPAAVLQLLDRHNRDGAAIAQRLGVPLHKVPRAVAGSPFHVTPVLRLPLWKEVALWWPARRALVVAEVLGTTPVFAVGPGPVGVHPMLRLRPPGHLAEHSPAHLLVGHGPPVHGPETGRHVRDALERSIRDLPRVFLALPGLLRG
jgi:hypothetical protein